MNESIEPQKSIPFPRTPGEMFRQLTGDGASAHPIVQFVKYGAVGAAATLVDMFVFFLASWFLFPALTQDDIFVKLFGMFGVTVPVVDITAAARANNQLINNLFAFLASNTFCYILNRLFVFKPGRHHILKEFFLFFLASGISNGCGILLADTMVRWFGAQTSISYIIKIISSVLINYAARKKIVFNG